MSVDVKTTRWLIAENSEPAKDKPCGCCGNYSLYRITLADGTAFVLCVDCDTEKR